MSREWQNRCDRRGELTTEELTFGVVADEIDSDLEQACQVARELGMRAIEINDYRGTPMDQLSPDAIAAVRDTIGEHDLRLDAVGTLALKALELGKTPDLATSVEFAEQLQTIRRAARVARELAPVSIEPAVRIFSFRREPMVGLGNPSPILPDGGGIDDATLERIVTGLHRVCDVARDEGVSLLVENVRSCWGKHRSQHRPDRRGSRSPGVGGHLGRRQRLGLVRSILPRWLLRDETLCRLRPLQGCQARRSGDRLNRLDANWPGRG